MGLSPLLVDTYRRYKKETETFINWLASTARATGKVNELFVDQISKQEQPGAGRLKGKARKEAKKQPTAPAPTTFQLSVKSLIKLANAIINDVRVAVPTSMMHMLQDVIENRKSCAAWYNADQTDAETTPGTSKDGHQYFIGVLEEIKATLSQKAASQKVDNHKANGHPLENVTNIFEHLELEDTNDVDSDPARRAVKQPNVPSVTYRIEKCDEDIAFAIYCLLKDATDIRLFVRHTWKEYRQDVVSLEIAALTMSAGIKMIEDLSKDFTALFPQFEDHRAIGHFISTRGPSQPTKDSRKTANDIHLTSEFGGKELNMAVLLCERTTELLSMLLLRPLDENHPLLLDSEVILGKCFSQLRVLSLACQECPFHDEVLRAVAHIVKDPQKQLPTWCVFAVQIFRDTQHELDGQQESTFRKFQDDLLWVASRCDELLEPANHEGVMLNDIARDELLDIKKHSENYASDDLILQMLRDCIDEHRPELSFGKDFLLSNHPRMAGLILHRYMQCIHNCSMAIAGSAGSILAAAHLYNAAHKTGLLVPTMRWADMDWFIEKQGSDWMFVGKRPESGREFWIQKFLAFGESITRFARDLRSVSGKCSYKGMHRHFRYLARQSELQVERRHPTGKITSEKRPDFDTAATIFLLVQDYITRTTSKNDKSKKNAGRRVQPMTTIETLTKFKRALAEDELPYRFDVGSFTLRSINLMRAIQLHLHKSAPSHYSRCTCGRDGGMNRLIGTMLMELDPTFRPGRADPQLPAAVGFLRDVIEKEGGVELSKAHERMPSRHAEEVIEADVGIPFEDNIPMEVQGIITRAYLLERVKQRAAETGDYSPVDRLEQIDKDTGRETTAERMTADLAKLCGSEQAQDLIFTTLEKCMEFRDALKEPADTA